MKNPRPQSDRERILVNIASILATELAHLQNLPAVREYMQHPGSLCHIYCKCGWTREEPFKKEALVVAQTSTGIQVDNPFLISFMQKEETDKHGFRNFLLRAIGSSETCYYGNESFVEIVGIDEKFLLEGPKWQFHQKLCKAIRKLDTYIHRYRGVEFLDSKNARVWFGEIFGGLKTRSKPYSIDIKFSHQTTIRDILIALKAGGHGVRTFEPEDGVPTTFQNPQKITAESLVGSLEAQGITIKKQPEVES